MSFVWSVVKANKHPSEWAIATETKDNLQLSSSTVPNQGNGSSCKQIVGTFTSDSKAS